MASSSSIFGSFKISRVVGREKGGQNGCRHANCLARQDADSHSVISLSVQTVGALDSSPCKGQGPLLSLPPPPRHTLTGPRADEAPLIPPSLLISANTSHHPACLKPFLTCRISGCYSTALFCCAEGQTGTEDNKYTNWQAP